ncbi:hypothetical protein M0813_20801 [Anaeramoeba flamelloides]|uniref:Uncharacterized protein n=1 Tax=Anaeramoeba flamelloides TaxID=1746091 RepID=A0ABQ8YJC6_9EUKA|nr:hypothetical protein M0813_20801 [Anaeramoeba flamelloides]
MNQNQENEHLGFYPLLWQFGDYLYRKVQNDQLFSLSQYTEKFLLKYYNTPKLIEVLQPRLKLIKLIFNQNYVFVRPDTGSRGRSRKRNKNTQPITNQSNSSSGNDLQQDNFYLSETWRKIFLCDDQKQENNSGQSLSSSKKVSSRANRTIGVLGFSISKMLQKEPCTKEVIENNTGFSRQRICTVLSIYKSINLVSDNQSNNMVYWNQVNGQVLSEAKKYVSDILLLRQKKRKLAERVFQLTKKMNKKINQKIEHVKNGKEKEKKNQKKSKLQQLKIANDSISNISSIAEFLMLCKKSNHTVINKKDENGMEFEMNVRNDQKKDLDSKKIASNQLMKQAKIAINSIQESKKELKRLNQESKKDCESNKSLFNNTSQKKIKKKIKKKSIKILENSPSGSLPISTLDSKLIKKDTSGKISKRGGSNKNKNKNIIKSPRKNSNNSKKKKLSLKKKRNDNSNKTKSLNKNKVKKRKKKRKQNKFLVKGKNSHDKECKFQDQNVNGRIIEKWNKKSSEETEAVLAILRLKSEKNECFEPITLMIDNEIQQLDNNPNDISYLELVKQK